MKKIDLHIHTNLSDGSLSPIEVIDKAYKNKVITIAIADHDTIDAYSDELFNYAKIKNINIITAVEISTKFNNIGFHVLGYNFDIKNNQLNKRLFMMRNSRHIYLHDVSKKLNELGYIINVSKLDKIEAVTKAHIASDIIDNVNNHRLLIKTFSHIPTIGEFIETLMNEGSLAYVEKKSITPNDAAILIKNAGGKVILAHPVASKYEDDFTEEEILNLLKAMEADGIEANYIYIDKDGRKINECEKWNKFAQDNNLITTVGSDFHKEDGIHPTIGLINEDINLTDDEINTIINNLLN